MVSRSSNRNGSTGFLCLISFYLVSSSSLVCGFNIPTVGSGGVVEFSSSSSSQPTRLFSEASSSSEGSAERSGSLLVERRDFVSASLLGGLSLAAAASTGWNLQQQQATTSSLLKNDASSYSAASIDDVVALIDSQCDRRYLHALVATDYQQLLYRRVSPLTTDKNDDKKYNNPILISSGSTGLNQKDNNSKTTPKAQDFINALTTASLVEDLTKATGSSHTSTTPYHLTLTGYKPREEGRVMSLWPLGNNIHFAWPKEAEQQDLLSLSKNEQQRIIVDGIDCGVMSLEDALERPQGQQVMVYSPDSYLLVPASMEQDLIAKLKDSFII